jgi:hypothetical protein
MEASTAFAFRLDGAHHQTRHVTPDTQMSCRSRSDRDDQSVVGGFVRDGGAARQHIGAHVRDDHAFRADQRELVGKLVSPL